MTDTLMSDILLVILVTWGTFCPHSEVTRLREILCVCYEFKVKHFAWSCKTGILLVIWVTQDKFVLCYKIAILFGVWVTREICCLWYELQEKHSACGMSQSKIFRFLYHSACDLKGAACFWYSYCYPILVLQ